MKELSQVEKNEFTLKMKEFVDRTNQFINPYYKDITLIEVGYGVFYGAYLYFDYPYNKDLEELNNSIVSDPKNRGLDVEVFEVFQKFQKEHGEGGYIHWKYKYYPDENKFCIYEINNNLGIRNDDHLALRYLPIIYQTTFLTKTYMADSEFVNTQSNADDLQELVLICKVFGEKHENMNNILTSTYTVNNKYVFQESVAKKLYESVLFFLESYFDSPVLQKIIEEKRKSEILAYQHTISNLRLYGQMASLGMDIKTNNINAISKSYNDLNIRMKILRMMHFCIFQIEYLNAGYPDLNNSGIYDLADKSIFKMLEYFDQELNLKNVRMKFSCTQEAKELDFIPKKNGDSDQYYTLFDCQMVLWNLWANACNQAQLQNENEIHIHASNQNGKLCLTFENAGSLPKEYKDFLDGKIIQYPGEIDPNRPYRGLEVIKDICRRDNNKWKTEAIVSETNKSTTKISLTF